MLTDTETIGSDREASGDMMYILPVEEPIVFDPADVPFEELPFTSWVVDEPVDEEVAILPIPEGFDPADVPFEDLPFTSWVVDDPGARPAVILGPPDVLAPPDDEEIRLTVEPYGDDIAETGPVTATDADAASIEGAVERLYDVALGRVADASGLAFWTDVLLNGGSFGDVADAFADRFEFNGQVGDALDDAAYIDGLYEIGLERPADAPGAAFWLDRLADPGIDRGDILMAFADAEDAFILG